MNCKPGDLAVLVNVRRKENLRKIVRVVGPANVGAEKYGMLYLTDLAGPHWEIEGRVLVQRHIGGCREVDSWFCPDSCMRPIRDNDGADETLTWAGKPEKVTA